MPEIVGHTRISVGDHVSVYGKLTVYSGRTLDAPILWLGSGVQIGHNVQIVVGQEVILESGVLVSNNCLITDTETHSRLAEERRDPAGPLTGRDIQPVRIGKDAWIGDGCTILKGVTIGQGAIVGSNSVVISGIPDHAIAMGNPARVIGSVGRQSGNQPAHPVRKVHAG
jgi:acetyltransferase-like isoleucine patch superfamily enzyme